MSTLKKQLKNENDTRIFAESLGRFLSNKNNFIIFLEGDLGAGKTTLTRYLLNELGIKQKIKSPSFTVVESYSNSKYLIHHFDLFRFNEVDNYDWLGIDEYLSEPAILIIEWPNKAFRQHVTPDININIAIKGSDRCLSITSESILGQEFLSSQ
jgi:tRNA threonylcarbamoyladenosine biosynthesis protein TsaE